MIELDELEDLFSDLDEVMPTESQKADMYDIYREDFFNDYVEIDGLELTLKSQKSWIKGFHEMPETFVHLVTREMTHGKPRTFDAKRANRIHWIKPILVQRDNPKINYFEKIDKGYLKQHYWFREKDFVVILKAIKTKILLVTAFYVDKLKKVDFDWDLNKYNESL
jgi:hypothetical protein